MVDDGHGLPSGPHARHPRGDLAVAAVRAARPDAGRGAAAGSTVTQQDLLDAHRRAARRLPRRGRRAWTGGSARPRTSPRTCRRAGSSPTWCAGSSPPTRATAPSAPTRCSRSPATSCSSSCPCPVDRPRPWTRGLGGLLGGILGGGLNLLNYTTFYAMKERSAVVGSAGLAPLLSAIARPGLRLHLAGHSFGARLVSAATKALPAGTTVASVALLQGAFSHFGFAADWDLGHAGSAVGPLPLRRRRAEGDGPGADHPHRQRPGRRHRLRGGLAARQPDRRPPSAAPTTATAASGATVRNGPTRPLPGTLLPVGGAYPWQPHRPHNLLADAFVADHSDVKGREVAYALLSAAADDLSPLRLDEGQAQGAQGVVVAGPDGARRDAQRRGGPLGGDVAVVELEQHPAVLGREPLQRAGEQAAVEHVLVAAVDLRLDGRLRRAGSSDGCGPRGRRRSARCRSTCRSQGRSGRPSASSRARCRQARRNVSCTASSAACRSSVNQLA